MAARAATAAKPKSAKATTRATTTRAKKATTAKKTVTVKESETDATTTLEKPTKRRRAKAETRTRIYWAVFNQDLKRVAVFEFDQKPEAEKRAAALVEKSGNHHFIQKIKATVQA